ncbi:MAG: glycosyltransferase family 4 protein [Anaerolineaceae bacterium]|nr:glycosyltransferase family 4 protein [Anaerolineaceae bacterium]
MRILHLVHQYPPDHVGGTELYTVWLSRALQQQGHDVAIFHRRSADGTGLARREEDSISIWSAWHGRFQPTNRLLSTFRSQPLLHSFQQVIADFQPDVVHVEHLMGLPTQLLTFLHAQHIPYVVTLWDFWWICANAQLLTNYDQTLCTGPDRFLNCARCALARANLPQFPPAIPALALPLSWRNGRLRQALQHASQLIAPAEFVKQWYVDHGLPAAQIEVLPPGLDHPEKPAVPPHAPFRVGYIGGLSWQKGVHVLVEAFNQLPETAELWLAGDPDFDPDYVKQLKAVGRPTFLGRLERTAVWHMLAQVDVVVVPSLWYETFVFVISEAFAMGVPVVASDLGVLAERVRHSVDGLLFPPGDAARLAQALQTLHDDPALQARLRQNILPVATGAEHAAVVAQLYAKVISLQKQDEKIGKAS